MTSKKQMEEKKRYDNYARAEKDGERKNGGENVKDVAKFSSVVQDL